MCMSLIILPPEFSLDWFPSNTTGAPLSLSQFRTELVWVCASPKLSSKMTSCSGRQAIITRSQDSVIDDSQFSKNITNNDSSDMSLAMNAMTKTLFDKALVVTVSTMQRMDHSAVEHRRVLLSSSSDGENESQTDGTGRNAPASSTISAISNTQT